LLPAWPRLQIVSRGRHIGDAHRRRWLTNAQRPVGTYDHPKGRTDLLAQAERPRARAPLPSSHHGAIPHLKNEEGCPGARIVPHPVSMSMASRTGSVAWCPGLGLGCWATKDDSDGDGVSPHYELDVLQRSGPLATPHQSNGLWITVPSIRIPCCMSSLKIFGALKRRAPATIRASQNWRSCRSSRRDAVIT